MMKRIRLFVLLLAATCLVAQARPMDEDGGPQDRPPPPPMEEDGPADSLPPPGPGGRPPPVQALMQRWKEKDPAEFERMQRLREEDPEAFRAELHKKLEALRRDKGMGGRGEGERKFPGGGPGGDFDPGDPALKASETKIHDLAEAWRKANGDEEKAQARAKLQSALGEAFDRRENVRRERLAQMEKKISELRSTLEQRQAQRETIIEKRLEELTSGNALSW